MLNDEQVVLDFFSQTENLPLALIAADHLDGIRLRLNNEFWIALSKRIDELLAKHALDWHGNLTEDRNNDKCLVGLHMLPQPELGILLRPFMEQQFVGDSYRIYYGLMWSSAPNPAQKQLAAVETLRQALQQAGFKESDNFLAWQWLPWHPREKEFLLRFVTHRDSLMEDAEAAWSRLMVAHNEELQLANRALNEVPRNITVSLDTLRSKLK